jgi:hypothetical protein
MKKYILFCVLMSLFYNEIQAQSNFLEGYLLISEKDTLYGKIDNKEYYDNSQFCDFKDVKTDSVFRYYPEKIYGYRFKNGKYYVSKTIKIDNKQIRLFLEYLIHGNLDVYFYLDRTKQGHYFASKDSLPINELKYSENEINIDGRQMLQTIKGYMGILSFYTQDCQLIKKDIPKLNKLDHKKLINFAEKYHNLTCKDEKCIIYEKKLPRKVKFNVSGGPSYYFSDDFDLNHTTNPSYGFNLLFQQSQKSEKIYLGIGLYRAIGLKGVLKGYQIPLSINYISPRIGFSPIISYEFDLNFGFIVQALKLGINYQMKNMSVFLNTDVKTVFIIKPYASSVNLGLNIDLR